MALILRVLPKTVTLDTSIVLPARRVQSISNTLAIYHMARKIEDTQRSGTVIDNVREPMTDWMFRERPESVAEHSYKFSTLWAIAQVQFSEDIYGVDLADLGSNHPWHSSLNQLRQMYLDLLFSLFHDVAEGDENGPGDVPHNGCEEHELVKPQEAAYFTNMASLFPAPIAAEMITRYDGFETYGAHGEDSEQSAMQASKFFDKLEAVFTTLNDTTRFHRGYIGRTEKYDNAVDFKRAKYLGTNNPADNWMFGLRKILREERASDVIMNLILELAYAEMIKYRKTIPYCLTADLDGCE